MPNGGRRYPSFRISWRSDEQLRAHGLLPWTYYAITAIRFATGTGTRQRLSAPIPVRLDTGTFVSAIPEAWLTAREFNVQRFLRPRNSMSFGTAAGRGSGRMAVGVPTLFQDAPGQQHLVTLDWLVTSGLNSRTYGLLSLRDVINHFVIVTEGEVRVRSSSEPESLPILLLIPRPVGVQIRYTCPNCGIQTWGRPGLRLGCSDCGTVLQGASR
jgi:hypothetical protein